jgi:hypothetical protein
VMTDFLKVHGSSISPLIGQLRWLLPVYLLFAVFIDAGLLAKAAQQTDQEVEKAPAIDVFWQGGARYFFSFLKIAAIFLLFALLWTVLVFAPIGSFLQDAIAYFPNEKYIVWGLFVVFLVYLLGLNTLFLWSVLSRFYRIKMYTAASGSLFRTIKAGWQFLQKNKKEYAKLLGLFICAQLVLVLIYWLLEVFLGMKSPFLIVFMVLVQQVFAFSRVLFRQALYSSINLIFSHSPVAPAR